MRSTRQIRNRFRAPLIAVLATGAFVLTACGGSDISSKPRAEVTYASDDPLAPKPLPKKTKVTIAASAPVGVFAVPFVAQELGEFEKENLDVQLIPSLLTSDAMGLIGAGKLDALWGSMSASLLNGIEQGIDAKIVAAAGAVGVGNNNEGFWATKELVAGLPGSVQKKFKVGSTIGAGTSQAPPLSLWLEENGGSLDNVDWVQIPGADIGTALENGAIDMGYISSPTDVAYKGSDKIELVLKSSLVNAQSVVVFGNDLLDGDPAVGEALLRASARTIRDHLHGDYKSDPDVVAAMVRGFNSDEKSVQLGAPLEWSDSIEIGTQYEDAPAGTPPFSDFLQDVFLEAGDILTYSTPLTPEQIFDPTFRDAVIRP